MILEKSPSRSHRGRGRHTGSIRAAATIVVLLSAFAAVTVIALEGNEVAVLHTRDASGSVRETRVWLAEQDGALWVEAATPERPFYVDLLREPRVAVVRGDVVLDTTAVPEPGDAGHRRIRALLAAKYGWADAWVGLLQDTSRSVAVRLTPAPRDANATVAR
jgi:hypothetical protein